MAEIFGFLVIMATFLTFQTVCSDPCEELSEDEWVWYPEMSTCYLVSNHSRTFDSSLDFCESFNGTLLSISGQTEDEFVQKYVRKCIDPAGACADVRNNEGQHWIGLTKAIDIIGSIRIPREQLKRYWRWADDTTYNTSYMKWYEDPETSVYEPNGGVNYDCVRLISIGYWADQKCRTPFRFICEKVVVFVPPPPPNIGLAVGMSVLALIAIVILILLGLWCAQRIKGLKSYEFEEDDEFRATPFVEEKDPNRNDKLSVTQQEDTNTYTDINMDHNVLKSKESPGGRPTEPEKNTDTGPIYSEAQTTKSNKDLYAILLKKNCRSTQDEDIQLAVAEVSDDECGMTMKDNEVYSSNK